MSFIVDDLYIYNLPLIYRISLQRPNGSIITMLPESYNIKHLASLKSTDEFNFIIPYFDENKNVNENFSKLRTGYQVHVELLSPETENVFMEKVFQIVGIENSDQNGIICRNISCKSLEIQLSKKILKNYKGSKVIYRFQSEIDSWSASETYPTKQSFIDSGILNTIVGMNVSWSVDESSIDSSVNSIYRFVEIDSSSCLDFLLTTVQESFLCLFRFNTVNKTISCKSLTNIGTDRGFFLSNNSVILNHVETVSDDDICTKLYMYGKESLSLRGRNPTGEDYILNFSYYRNSNFMSDSLMLALDNYDLLLESKETEFSTLLASLNSNTSLLSVKNNELALLKAALKVLQIELDELIAEDADLTSKYAQIEAKEDEISAKEAEIVIVNNSIITVTESIEALQTEILMSNNFSLQQLSELDQFIKEKTVNDETITDVETLYTEAISILEKVNQPSVNFEIDLVDIYSAVECQLDWDKISLGDIGTIKNDLFGTDIQLRLLQYEHDYDSSSLKLSFGNRNNINDPNKLIEDLKSTISTTTTLDINKYKTLDYYNNDKTAIQEYITNILNLANQGAVAGANQSISINEHGITLTNTAYPLQQVRILNTGIYLTNDGWQSSKWALTPDGINAEILRSFLGEFCTVKADRIQINDDGSGLNEIGVKVTHVDGNYTSMESDGFLRYTPVPTYTETPTGVPNTENFTTHDTIAELQADGWEFGGSYSMGTNEFLLGALAGRNESYARVSKYITKENTTFSFTYRNYVDTHAKYYFYIDGVQYELLQSATNVTFPASGTITLSEGWHTFQWHNWYTMALSGTLPTQIYMYFDNITFEQSPVSLTQSGTDIVGSTYNYMTYTGNGSTLSDPTYITRYPDTIYDAWVQLPDEFKGKNFKVNVFLQDTGSSADMYGIGKILIKVVDESIDYENAKFKVRARLQKVYSYYTGFSNASVEYWQGCDFAYVCTC